MMAASLKKTLVLWAILYNYCKGESLASVMFSRKGENVTMQCARKMFSNCSTITWNYNKAHHKTVELVGHGKVKENENKKRDGRLNVDTNCVLHIQNIIAEDAGLYSSLIYHSNGTSEQCEQVYFSVLKIFPSIHPSFQPKLQTGTTVTLSCILYTYNCEELIYKKIKLTWVAQNGHNMKNEGRSKITESRCSSTLTVTLDQLDHNRKWACQVSEDGQVKTSLSYTTSLSVTDVKTTSTSSVATTPNNTTNSITTGDTGIELPVRLTLFCLTLALPLIIGVVIYIKKGSHSIKDQQSSGIEHQDYVNLKK